MNKFILTTLVCDAIWWQSQHLPIKRFLWPLHLAFFCLSFLFYSFSLAKVFSSTDSPMKVQVSDFDDMKWFNAILPFNSSSPKSNSSPSIHSIFFFFSFFPFNCSSRCPFIFYPFLFFVFFSLSLSPFLSFALDSCCETIKSGFTCLTLNMSVLDS